MSKTKKRELRCFYEDDLNRFKLIDTSDSEVLENCYHISIRHNAFRILYYIITELDYIDDYSVLYQYLDLNDKDLLEKINDYLEENKQDYIVSAVKRLIRKHNNKLVVKIINIFSKIVKEKLHSILSIALNNKNFKIVKYFYEKEFMENQYGREIEELIMTTCIDRDYETLFDYFVKIDKFNELCFYLQEEYITIYEYALYKNKHEYFIDILKNIKEITINFCIRNLSFYNYNTFIYTLDCINYFHYKSYYAFYDTSEELLKNIINYEDEMLFGKSKIYWMKYLIDKFPQLLLVENESWYNYYIQKNRKIQLSKCYDYRDNAPNYIFMVNYCDSMENKEEQFELIDYYITKFNEFKDRISEYLRIKNEKINLYKQSIINKGDEDINDDDIDLSKLDIPEIEFEKLPNKLNKTILNCVYDSKFNHYIYFHHIFKHCSLDFIKKYVKRYNINVKLNYYDDLLLEDIIDYTVNINQDIYENYTYYNYLKLLTFNYISNDTDMVNKIEYLLDDCNLKLENIQDLKFLESYIGFLNIEILDEYHIHSLTYEQIEYHKNEAFKFFEYLDKKGIFNFLNSIEYENKKYLLQRILGYGIEYEFILKFIKKYIKDIDKLFKDFDSNTNFLDSNFLHSNIDNLNILREILGDNALGNYIREVNKNGKRINISCLSQEFLNKLYYYGFNISPLDILSNPDEDEIQNFFKNIDIIIKYNKSPVDTIIKNFMLDIDTPYNYKDKYIDFIQDEEIKELTFRGLAKQNNYYLLKKFLQKGYKLTSKIIKEYKIDVDKIKFVKDIEGEKKCVICLTNSPCVIINPCGHLNICYECSSHIENKCPFDNTEYKSLIYLNNENEEKRFNCQKCKIRTIHFAYPNCKHVTCSRCSFKTKCPICRKPGEHIKIYMDN